MVEALQKHLPPNSAKFTIPTGGMFVFLYFPTLKMSSQKLFEELVTYDLICLSGDEFYVPPASAVSLQEKIDRHRQNHPHDHSEKSQKKEEELKHQIAELTKRAPTLRLTFAAAKPEQIRLGIEKLGKCLRDILDKSK